MPTASTKQRAAKKERATAVAPTPSNADASRPQSLQTSGPEISERAWRVVCGAVLLVAGILRFSALELKPLHHDEGVNGFFLTTLFRQGVYHYDPANYHGPTLYYLTLPFVYLGGLNTTVVRFVPALFGVGTVWLMLYLRRYIGTTGALAAAALLAVSPGAVYQSRYFIHESLFVFFTLGIVIAALRYYQTAEMQYVLLAATSTGLLFATKETAFISVGVLVMATLVAYGWLELSQRFGWADAGATQRMPMRDALERLGGVSRVGTLLLIAVALFLVINVLFYSSFFTYEKGLRGAVETFKIWTKTSAKDHLKPFDTYLLWLQQEEGAIYVLSVVGAAWALLWPKRNRFAVFAGAWAFGTLAAYSLIKYKTPWLSLNFILPMALIGGYAVNLLDQWEGRAKLGRALALSTLGVAVAVGAYQSVKLNFYHYDNERYPYVYAHTQRGFLRLVGDIERLAARAGTGKKTPVNIVSPDYWPMPWYLREYERIGYAGRVGFVTEPIVVGHESQLSQLQTTLAGSHKRVGDLYPLRPGVKLVLFARNDLAAGG